MDNKTLSQHVDDTILDMLEEQEEQVESNCLLIIVWIPRITLFGILPALT